MMIGGLRLPKQVPAVLRYETKLGEYAQIDWGLSCSSGWFSPKSAGICHGFRIPRATHIL
jgi:hypothetical protein